MNERKHYFRVGVFLMAGIFILAVGIVLFGGRKMFEQVFIVETYFAGSVQGLDVGSPVKFRGVKIGEVKDIHTVNQEYKVKEHAKNENKNLGLYIMVTVALSRGAFPELEELRVKQAICDLVERQGLRLKIAYIGVTGLAYLDIDFYDAERYPPLEIAWDPQYIYIPSVPNTIQVVEDAIQNITYSLRDDFIPLIRNLNSASEQFPEFSKELNATLISLQNSLKMVEQSSKDFPQLTEQLNETFYHINEVFRNERYDIEETMNNLRLITEDLKEITKVMKNYPSYMIFSDNPPKTGVAQ
jgi:paraquat-inducible protein B